MLAKRYEYDGASLLPMNRLQIEVKKEIGRKIAEGLYRFEDVPCSICSGREFEALAGKDRYGLYTPVVICRSCGLVQTNPRMSEECYRGFYASEYHQLTEGTKTPSSEFFRSQYRRGRKIFKYLLDHEVLTKEPANLFVVEIGCGAGGILQYFKEMGCAVKGSDLDHEYLAFGRTRYGLDLSLGTIADTQLETPADLVIYAHVLEHIAAPREELIEVSRRLSESGLVYIEVPGVKNLARDYQLDFLRLLQNSHMYHFTLASLTNLLAVSGFSLVVGDETIRSVFRRENRGERKAAVVSDYSVTLAYLNRMEKRRNLLRFRLWTLWRSVMIRMLKMLRLYTMARNLYLELKK